MPRLAHTAALKAEWQVALLALLLCWLTPTHAAAPQRSSFDHLTTGFELLGQHRDLPCESCHVNAIFKGTPKVCNACHGVGTTVRATAKPTNHMMSTDQCDSCHTEVAWNPAFNFDHKQALGSCSSCHNGVQAQGKPPNHIVTDLECDACHTTVSWAGATFTHAGVTSGCAQCHNNVSAQGMPSNHIPIGTPPAPCEACHSNTNFTNWLGAKINHPAVSTMLCATCHETANFLGMHSSTNTTAADSRPNATLDPNHAKGQLATGDCGQCHDTTSFSGSASLKPANHIPTSAPCAQCHTTGVNSVYSVVGVHQGVTSCLSCHAPAVATTFINVTIVTTPANHIPIGGLDCNASGCHTTANVNPGGFSLGQPSVNVPTLGATGHATVSAVGPCTTCHETAQSPSAGTYKGMIAATGSAATDIRPTAYDKYHPLPPGDCGTCHTTTPTFAKNQTTTATPPAGHVPIAPPTYAAQPACSSCHTTTGDFTQYSVSAVHQAVNGCAACHGSGVNTTFLNVTPLTTPTGHIPIGVGAAAVDCNGSGCHSANGGAAGGFKIGTASLNPPTTLGVPGHATVATAVPACLTCHENGTNYLGMIASNSGAWGDTRPTAYDSVHPTTGDCSQCHTTTPTFATNMTAGSKPANHIPTTAACVQCHKTINNYASYDSTGVHTGVTSCNACHGSGTGPFAGPPPSGTISIVGLSTHHIPVGSLDCGSSGCHTTANVTPGGNGFKIGSPNINAATLNSNGHTTVQTATASCATCHETAQSGTGTYDGMMPSTNTAAGDSRPNATLDSKHPTQAAAPECGTCHVQPPSTFASGLLPTATKPAGHMPTPNNPPCAQCHTTAGTFTAYSVVGVHQGISNGCQACHGGAGVDPGWPFLNVTPVTPGNNHIPIGTGAAMLDCSGSGCHTTANVNPGGFKIGSPSINVPTLTTLGHNTVAGVTPVCQTCHQAAQYIGMIAATGTAATDLRPTAFDSLHPVNGDCGTCHTTSPTFATNQTGNAKPGNHIPTLASQTPCSFCHTTPGNFALFSVTATHQGVTTCINCHGPTVNTTFANVVPLTTPNLHIPIGTGAGMLDCSGAGCHTTANVNPGGFKIGSPSINVPTLTVPGHSTVAGVTPVCQTCHQAAQYVGMIAATGTAATDLRPTAYDSGHPTSGDCGGCHSTSPTFASNQTAGSKPSNHIPTLASQTPCSFCHTTAGNYQAYSVTATHQGVTTCINCHGSTVNTTFANVVPVTTPLNTHIPIGGLDCNGSGCHSTANVNTGGFHIGAASVTVPTLTVPGHTTIAGTKGVSGCQTCHEKAQYLGMVSTTGVAATDLRPTAYDSAHPKSGDCNGCHTTSPTFSTNQSGGAAKPANHIPTNAKCAQCHTTAGNYAVYTMGATGHTGITNNCAQCHAYGLSFYNMAPPTLKEPPSGATGHIPAVPPNGSAAIACELCHSPTVFTTFSGTTMRHAYVTSMKCYNCHDYNMRWKTNAGLWTRPDPNHHAGQDCGGSGCHTSCDSATHCGTGNGFAVHAHRATASAPVARGGGTSSATSSRGGATGATRETALAATGGTGTVATQASPAAPFDHASASGTACVSCHEAAGGTGKPVSHLATGNRCQSCHSTIAWLPVTRVDHTQVLGTCASCHNGQLARGKRSSHFATTAACETCHTTLAWTPARFDHAAVTPHTCTSCHNAVRAIGLPRAHIPTTQSCDTCHGTLAWSPVKVDHTHLTASCVSCHNNIGAVGLSPGHLRTQLDCARCHSYPDWSLVNFRHTATAYPAGRHAKLACTSCHTTATDQVPYPSAADAGTCAGCHAKDFRPAAHPKTAKGATYSAHELADCTGACHVYSDTTQSTVTRSLPGPHHRVTDATLKR